MVPVAFGLLASGLTAVGIAALVLAVLTIINVVRDDDLSGSAKAVWLIIAVLFPIVGSIVYFGVRSEW